MSNATDESLTLSAAILSPINSLFEAQVQSARSFLSFILQLGFKEIVSTRDIEDERKRIKIEKSQGKMTDEEFNEAVERLNKLEKLIGEQVEYKQLKTKEGLTDEEQQRLRELDELLEDQDMKDDIYSLRFQYRDGRGVEHTIEVPALALVPVQPLAIQSATFEFSMSVSRQTDKYNTKQKGRALQSSPWAFIEPRRISGKIESGTSNQINRGISVHVEVGSTPIPAGLSSLLTSLTQSARIIE